jgi:hypothetical protein
VEEPVKFHREKGRKGGLNQKIPQSQKQRPGGEPAAQIQKARRPQQAPEATPYRRKPGRG